MEKPRILQDYVNIDYAGDLDQRIIAKKNTENMKSII